MTDDKQKRRPYRHYPDWYKQIRNRCKHKSIWIILDNLYDQPIEVIYEQIKLYNKRLRDYTNRLKELPEIKESEDTFAFHNTNLDKVSEKSIGLTRLELKTLIKLLWAIYYQRREEEWEEKESNLHDMTRLGLPVEDCINSGIERAKYIEEDRYIYEEEFEDVDTMEELYEEGINDKQQEK